MTDFCIIFQNSNMTKKYLRDAKMAGFYRVKSKDCYDRKRASRVPFSKFSKRYGEKRK